jgi:hyperpolarization activated cyclic nucleotide-gated potassium channel 1
MKDIAMEYVKGWFFIDLISVIPFDLIFAYSNVNRITRFSRLGRISKIVRMIKMVRLLKIAKVHSKLMKNF